MNPRRRFVVTLILASLATIVIGSNAYLLLGRDLDSVFIGYALSVAFMTVVTLLAFKLNLDTKTPAPGAGVLTAGANENETAAPPQPGVETHEFGAALRDELPDTQEATLSEMAAENAAFRQLFARVGRSSKVAGLGFVALTIIFLFLSVTGESIVFQIDSIAAFLAAIVLLFKDPRARVQGRVLDAIMLSSNQALEDLSALDGASFAYVPAGNSIEGVVVVARRPAEAASTGGPQGKHREEVTPPGRALAEVFSREAGLKQLTLEVVRASLPPIMRENFGLASSVDINETGDEVEVTMHETTATCGRGNGSSTSSAKGFIGCTVASFLAILVSASTARPVLLGECAHDEAARTWTVPMTLEPKSAGME
jgi:hypothetical protein